MKSQNKCSIKGCKNQSDIIYYGKPVCSKCFDKHCDNKINLKVKLNIKEFNEKRNNITFKPINTLKTNVQPIKHHYKGTQQRFNNA